MTSGGGKLCDQEHIMKLSEPESEEYGSLHWGRAFPAEVWAMSWDFVK